MAETKRAYGTPTLVDYGSITKLTQGASGETPGPMGPVIDIIVELMIG